MLFQRLYNWIKYKTLPSSFLFKNRLFIERDSKHRRVMSNFGLSFRNSKWTNYETYNIKNQFRSNYLKYILWILTFFIIIIFSLNFKNYYISHFFFNNVSFLFWISIDTFDYYLSFVVWAVTMFFSSLFNSLYSYFFFNNFSKKFNTEKTFSQKPLQNLLINKNNFSSKDLYVSKHDLHWILYSWLTNPSSQKSSHVLENLFENKINNTWWTSNYNFFTKLYKLSFYINLSSEKNTSYFLSMKLNKLNNNYFKGDYLTLIHYFNNSSLLNTYTPTLLSFFLNNYKNYFEKKNARSSSLNFLKNKNEWNLYNFNTENNKYSFLLKHKDGLFFLNDFNYQKLSYFIFNFNELWALNDSIKNQLNSSKWNRWLYRYSILHRKSLKNAHKITLTKRLINSGFYDSKIFDKNVWASEHLNKILSKENFTSLFNNTYSNIFSNSSKNYVNHKLNINNNGSQIESLNLLNFYENSYFWYLKRFYSFNTLNTNFIKSKLQFTSNTSIDQSKLLNDSVNKHSIFLNYLLKSTYLNLNSLTHFNNSSLNFNELYKNSMLNNNSNVYGLKDIYLFNNDNDLMSKDNLNIIYWITSNSNTTNNLNFFNYLNYNLNNSKYNINFFTSQSTDLNKWLIYSLLNLDQIYLNDVNYLSLFY